MRHPNLWQAIIEAAEKVRVSRQLTVRQRVAHPDWCPMCGGHHGLAPCPPHEVQPLLGIINTPGIEVAPDE